MGKSRKTTSGIKRLNAHISMINDLKPKVYKKKPKFNSKTKVIEAYKSALEELFFLSNPNFKKNTPQSKPALKKFLETSKTKDIWIYYKDRNTLVHTVNESNYFKLRTARNKNVITENEQFNFRKLSVGIAGLSVGSCILAGIVTSGGSKNIKIADFDNLEITNLNRIKAKLTDIGSKKTTIAAKEVWDLDPFAKLSLYDKGLTQKNLKEFILKKPKLNVFIDEMDSIPMKVQARLICKSNKIPVIMATDNGDTVILDIERFDQEPQRKIFHGTIKDTSLKNLDSLTYKEWLKIATQIVSPKHLTPQMQNSLLLIGKELAGVPQLGTIANVAGAATCFVLRRIANKLPMPSGRYTISLEEKLAPNYNSATQKSLRNKQTKEFIKKFAIR